MVLAYSSSKFASYSREISESLYVAEVSEVSPEHKITFSEESNSSLTIKSSLSPYGYTGCLKKPKSNGIANRFSNVFLMAFSWVVTVRAVQTDFLHSPVPLNHWLTVCLEVVFLHVLFRSSKGPCMCHKYPTC